MRIRSLAGLFLFASVAAACGKGATAIDQKGPFLFRFDGTQTVVDNVEWGKTEERNGTAGRVSKDGKRIPGITSGTFVTRPFTADGKTVSIDIAFDMGKNTGAIKLGDKSCDVDKLHGGRGEIQGVRYRGFSGSCMLDGKEVEFYFGPVRPADEKDDPAE